MTVKKKTMTAYIKEYFEAHPNKNIKHDDVVDYVHKFIPKARDPWRAVRKLYQQGYLIQIKKGIYKRIHGYKGHALTAPFSKKVKESIFKRDNYCCVICGNGRHNGYELHADHIKPQAKGGKSTVANGQTLCSEHNLMKKRYGTTDFLNKYFEKMLKIAKKTKDKEAQKLFEDFLKTLKKHKK